MPFHCPGNLFGILSMAIRFEMGYAIGAVVAVHDVLMTIGLLFYSGQGGTLVQDNLLLPVAST